MSQRCKSPTSLFPIPQHSLFASTSILCASVHVLRQSPSSLPLPFACTPTNSVVLTTHTAEASTPAQALEQDINVPPSPPLNFSLLFVTEMAPTTSSGYTTPDGELESILPPHPTAARRPHQIVVQSENSHFSDEYITSKYTDRGADVVFVDGQYIVKPTAQSYEFQTRRKVSKTGYASWHVVVCYRIDTEVLCFFVQVDDDWHWRKQRHDPRGHRPC